ncbi:hypothetical protein CDL15_Pgr014037 [Punica granatum]|uniref:Uncharacterized protein n=1 Tax=Punica granatum TaxID=22663 RepID=A0A218WA94_PUNGR|nr:hypothetical protein CDL15_Pgr014037 [Punica granatum]
MTSVGAAPGPSSSKYLIVVPKRHKHMTAMLNILIRSRMTQFHRDGCMVHFT